MSLSHVSGQNLHDPRNFQRIQQQVHLLVLNLKKKHQIQLFQLTLSQLLVARELRFVVHLLQMKSLQKSFQYYILELLLTHEQRLESHSLFYHSQRRNGLQFRLLIITYRRFPFCYKNLTTYIVPL